jgi:hypothetical protein
VYFLPVCFVAEEVVPGGGPVEPPAERRNISVTHVRKTVTASENRNETREFRNSWNTF